MLSHGSLSQRAGKKYAMEGSILALLERHGSLAYEQIAAHLDERPDAVRSALMGMRDRELIAALAIGELLGNRTNAATYWRLTDEGRTALARSRSARG
jgi:predicted ArsR family transcriptional regulator